MANDPTKSYPLPSFHFLVNWGGSRIGFTEVSGLDFETEVIEYREGSSPRYNKTKQPGLTRYSNVILKRGVIQGDYEFYQWWINTLMFQEVNAKFRRDVTIELLGETHQPVLVWTLSNAWPIKLESSSLNAGTNDILIETLVLTHEGLKIQTP
ncbi:MAG TPA: phage tail protein [Puia sp.]|nr:phage tail protein [Puia sp.]